MDTAGPSDPPAAAAATTPPPPDDALGLSQMASLDDCEEDADAGDYNDDLSSSDEEYNQRNFGIYQALPVDGEPDWSLSE